MEVVDDTLPEFPPVPPPLAAKIGEPFAWQPRVLVRDMRGLPAYASIESGGRNPNWYRRQLVGVRNKESQLSLW
eukprot:g27848.t1